MKLFLHLEPKMMETSVFCYVHSSQISENKEEIKNLV
jgi:hypothetical protein